MFFLSIYNQLQRVILTLNVRAMFTAAAGVCEVRLRLSAPSSVMHNGGGITVLRDITVYSRSKIKIKITICNNKKNRTSIWHPVTSGSGVGQVTILICFGNIVNLCSGRWQQAESGRVIISSDQTAGQHSRDIEVTEQWGDIDRYLSFIKFSRASFSLFSMIGFGS